MYVFHPLSCASGFILHAMELRAKQALSRMLSGQGRYYGHASKQQRKCGLELSAARSHFWINPANLSTSPGHSQH